MSQFDLAGLEHGVEDRQEMTSSSDFIWLTPTPDEVDDSSDSSDTETLQHIGYDGDCLRLFRFESNENDLTGSDDTFVKENRYVANVMLQKEQFFFLHFLCIHPDTACSRFARKPFFFIILREGRRQGGSAAH